MEFNSGFKGLTKGTSSGNVWMDDEKYLKNQSGWSISRSRFLWDTHYLDGRDSANLVSFNPSKTGFYSPLCLV